MVITTVIPVPGLILTGLIMDGQVLLVFTMDLPGTMDGVDTPMATGPMAIMPTVGRMIPIGAMEHLFIGTTTIIPTRRL